MQLLKMLQNSMLSSYNSNIKGDFMSDDEDLWTRLLHKQGELSG